MKEFVLAPDGNQQAIKIDYQNELNPEQLAVVTDGDGPCLVLAGAGSGKTRTITYRVAYLIEHGIDPSEILLVTFTNKAAKEMLSRVEVLLGKDLKGLWGGTFHSVANRILRMYAEHVGRKQNFTILDAEDSRDLIKVCIKDLKIDTTARRFPSPTNLRAIISYSRNAAISIDQTIATKWPNFEEIIIPIREVAEMYETRKSQANAMDFDDLLVLLRDILVNNPNIRDRLASQFRYVLVDEYQDTNAVQAEIVRQFSSVHNNVLVVGDDAQSIYSFRAANIRNILAFPQMYSGAKTFRLETNYRSTPQILALANASIAKNTNQFKKELRPVRQGVDLPSLVSASNAQQEARYVAEQLLRLRDEGISLQKMAVLFRAAFHSQALEFELMKRDIPYEYRGGMKFFERAHIKDLISHLRITQNKQDEVAWMRVLGLQIGIGLVTAGKIFNQIRHLSNMAEIAEAEPKMGKRAILGWQSFSKTATAMAKHSVPADIIRAVIVNGYSDYLEVEYPDYKERLDDLEQLATFAEGYDDLHLLLDEISLASDYSAVREEGAAQDDEKIVLSTVHQAKGLEWDVVFVINLAEGKFPNQRAIAEDSLEEERRLFYVATTRARTHLFLTYPLTAGGDSLLFCQPSTFIEEVSGKLFETVKLKEAKSNWGSNRGRTSSSRSWNEPIIILDDLGERQNKSSAGMSFLRDLDEL